MIRSRYIITSLLLFASSAMMAQEGNFMFFWGGIQNTSIVNRDEWNSEMIAVAEVRRVDTYR
ncbi:MAG: hypothetical protein M3Q97_02745, partial [Bacteroidota bacterium]|nr:hypothetical protein [Bacteroidota bacterium]